MFKKTLLLLGLSLLFGSTSSAQDSALELFSSDVDVVVRLAEPDQTIENIVALVNGAQPGFGEIARGAITPNLGQAISNPSMTGVDQSRDWYVGAYSNGKSEPLVVFAIPAVDADDFVAALGDGFKSSVHGKYVLYTDKGELPEVPASSKSMAKSMSESAQETLELGAVSIHVNSKHLVGVYGDELDTAYDQALEGLNQLRFAMPQDAGVNLGPIIEMYGAMAEKLFQGVKDSRSLTVAVSLGAEGVRIEEYIEFGNGSKSSRKLAELPTSDMADFARLPEGAFTYYGMSGGMADMIKWSMDLTAGMAENEETREKLDKAFVTLDEVTFGSMVGTMTISDAENGMIQATSIARIDPVDKFKDYMRSSIQLMNGIELPGLTQTSTIDEEAETYGDHKADIVTVKQEYDDNFPQAEMQKKFQEMMFGSAGIQSRVIYMDDLYLTVMGGGPAATKKAVEGLESSSNDGINEPRKVLMDKVNFIVLIDLPSGVAAGLKVASQLDEFPIPLDSQMIDNLNLAPSYIGFGIAAEENALRCRTDVPIKQIQGIAKLAMLFAGMRNQL